MLKIKNLRMFLAAPLCPDFVMVSTWLDSHYPKTYEVLVNIGVVGLASLTSSDYKFYRAGRR